MTIYRPANSQLSLAGTRYDSSAWLWGWGLLWAFAEASNFINHLNLRNIRTPPGEPRKYPTGYGFNLVTCSNYFFEILSWVALIGMSGGDFGREYLIETELANVSLRLPRFLSFHDGHVGYQEAQTVPQGARHQVPSWPQDSHPVHLVEIACITLRNSSQSLESQS